MKTLILMEAFFMYRMWKYVDFVAHGMMFS